MKNNLYHFDKTGDSYNRYDVINNGINSYENFYKAHTRTAQQDLA